MQITVNGSPHELAQDANVGWLLEQMQLQKRRIAVERNGEIVPRSRFAETALSDGDRIEIVIAVGGG